MRVDTSREADIRVICGSSGSGKSVYCKAELKKFSRVIIWDPDDEYDGILKVTRYSELLDMLARYPKGALKIRYVAQGEKAFDAWARAAFAWANCVALAEETADVTSPGKAPEGWGMLVRRGRKRGIRVWGVTQRPAESDKTIVGNASLIRVGRLARSQDRRYMAAELDVDVTKIAHLGDLEFIARNMRTGEVKRGKQQLPRKKTQRNGKS